MSLTRRIGFPFIAFAPDGVGGGAVAPSAPSGGGETSASASPAPSGASTTPDSGGTPAPDAGVASSASPTETAPASPQPIPSSFEGLEFLDDDTGDDIGIEPAPVVAAPVVPVVAPAPVVPAPAPATAAPATPATPAAPAAPAPATGPQEASAFIPSPAEPGRIAEQLLGNEQAFVDHMAANEYKLSEADIQALETDVVGAIPKLLSRVHLRAQAAALNQMQRVIPAMLQNQMKVMKRNSENEGKFYTRWPTIDASQHGETVSRLARTYRQMNPAASLDQMIEDLGPIVLMTAKIAPGAPNVAAPALAPRTVGGRPAPAPSPFRPAGTSAGGGSPQPGTDQNPWSGLAGVSDEEE